MTGYLCRNTQVARFFIGKEMNMNYEKLAGFIRAVIDRRPGDSGSKCARPGTRSGSTAKFLSNKESKRIGCCQYALPIHFAVSRSTCHFGVTKVFEMQNLC